MLLFGPWVWLGDQPRSEKLAAILLLVSFGIVVTMGAALAAAVTTARVDGDQLKFTFCGIPVRTIPLHLIIGYEQVFRRRGSIVILYGASWYCPNGLFNHAELEKLLESHGITEKRRAHPQGDSHRRSV